MTKTESSFRLDGKVALITGAYSDIGKALTKGLTEMGARAAVAGHNAAKAAALAKEIQGLGYKAYATAFDALSASDTDRLMDEVTGHYGCLDILVNCVAYNKEEKLGEITQEMFDRIIATIVRGSMFQAQSASRHMIRQGHGGRIINFGSVRSTLALRGRGFAAYTAAKGGLANMSKQLAAELAPHKITVNVVAPTFVRTEQAAEWLNDPQFYASLVERIPLGRIADPEDLVGAVVFLSSQAAEFITGQTLYLDGGVTVTQ